MPVIGASVYTPSAADVLAEDSLSVVVAQFAERYSETFKSKMCGVRIGSGMEVQVQIQMVTRSGLPIALTEYNMDNGDSFGSSLSLSSGETVYTLAAKMREATNVTTGTASVDVAVYNAADGIIRVTIPADTLPGIYLLETALLNSDGNPVYVYPCYVYSEFSAWSTGKATQGPPSLDSIRLGLRDSDMYENELIEQNEFDIAEIANAAVKTIQLWNESPPFVRAFVATTRTFRLPELWLNGIEYYLFQMAEEHYRRNKLTYQAGNTAIDDKNRDREYKAAWQERYQQLLGKIKSVKSSMNIARGFGSIRQA